MENIVQIVKNTHYLSEAYCLVIWDMRSCKKSFLLFFTYQTPICPLRLNSKLTFYKKTFPDLL